MTTAAEFALINDRKLLGKTDFDSFLLKYLRGNIEAATKRLFLQGSFGERMGLSSPGAGRVQVDLKPTLLDGWAHDGAGHLLDLEQITREARFENINGQGYEVGAGYVEYPVGIRINPRSGRPEYDHMIEGIGVKAVPDSVTNNGGTLTFNVDSLFESGGAGNHTGREVLVYMLDPAVGALTPELALEVCDVSHDGSHNIITTTGLLGQTAPVTTPSHYLVVLLGVIVSRDTAPNRPSERPDEIFFVGTVEGNGGTPSVFDVSGQTIVQAQAAVSLTVDPLANWADGETNPGGNAQAVFEKIVLDLTSTTGEHGAGKLSAAARGNWADGTTNPAARLSEALAKIVSDLTSTAFDRGAGKITSPALPDWANGETNPADTIANQLQKIVTDLTTTTAGAGAQKISTPEFIAWADGTPNSQPDLTSTLAKLFFDLSTGDGTNKIHSPLYDGFGTGYPIVSPAQPLGDALGALIDKINGSLVATKLRAEAVSAHSLRRIFTNPSWTLVDIAGMDNGSGTDTAIAFVAVGDHGSIVSRVVGGQWTARSPAGGFTGAWRAVACSQLLSPSAGFAIVGEGGNIQTSADAITWTSRKNTGNDFWDVAFKPDGTPTFCAVGVNGYIYTSTDLITWSPQTGAAGMTTATYVGITYAAGLFVVTTDDGRIMTSPDGITWTAQTSGSLTGTAPKYLARMLQWNSRFGFVALYTRSTGTQIGVAYSSDGVNWTIVNSAGHTNMDEPNVRLALLDESILYLSTLQDPAPYSLNAQQVVSRTIAPAHTNGNGSQYILDIGECYPFGGVNIGGVLYVVGRLNNGDGCIMNSAPFRPKYGFFPYV